MNSLLEIRRANAEPKCATCSWFKGGATSGGRCERHDMLVLDLSVCTDWREIPIQEVLKNDD